MSEKTSARDQLEPASCIKSQYGCEIDGSTDRRLSSSMSWYAGCDVKNWQPK